HSLLSRPGVVLSSHSADSFYSNTLLIFVKHHVLHAPRPSSCLATLAGNSWAAPIASDVSLVARGPAQVFPRAAPPAGAIPCSNDDQTDAGANDPDKNLPSCGDLGGRTPFPCTNSNLVAFEENLPFCNGTTLQSQGAAAVAALQLRLPLHLPPQRLSTRNLAFRVRTARVWRRHSLVEEGVDREGGRTCKGVDTCISTS
ncbi:hypothetical protein C8F04DRAFT_1241755, partial [Mycena alexandri]